MRATPHPRCADRDGQLEAESEDDEISQPELALRMQGSNDSSLRRNRIQATLWASLGRRAAVDCNCIFAGGETDKARVSFSGRDSTVGDSFVGRVYVSSQVWVSCIIP